jgi:glycosyltransferase involved in cell wall biosynthesis
MAGPHEPARRPRLAFLIEGHSGHVAHHATLERVAAGMEDVETLWFGLQPEPAGPIERLPPLSLNWSLRASVRTRSILERLHPRPDALFIHTQIAALLSVGFLRDIPTVVSTDATPKNMDELAEGYNQRIGPPPVEAAKRWITRCPFAAAESVVLFSEWARRSTIDDYGIAPERAVVIPPGVDLGGLDRPARAPGDVTRFLFVGGNFERKGGPVLLEALQALDVPWHLDAVTKSPVADDERVTRHADIDPNSSRLYELFQAADAFVFPTLADALGIVVIEAMAASLPVIATDITAIPEMVDDGRTGLLVKPGDARALTEALRWIAEHPAEREAMGRLGRQVAEERYDGDANARRVIELMRDLALSRG